MAAGRPRERTTLLTLTPTETQDSLAPFSRRGHRSQGELRLFFVSFFFIFTVFYLTRIARPAQTTIQICEMDRDGDLVNSLPSATSLASPRSARDIVEHVVRV